MAAVKCQAIGEIHLEFPFQIYGRKRQFPPPQLQLGEETKLWSQIKFDQIQYFQCSQFLFSKIKKLPFYYLHLNVFL